MTTFTFETKHTLAANLLAKLSIEEMKAVALSEVESGIDYLPTVLEFNAAKTDDVHYSEYLYAIISYGHDYDDIENITFIDSKGIDFAVHNMLSKLCVFHSDLGFDTHKEFGMKWLSEYDEDDMTAFD